jgi:hypothetical protein
MMNQFPEEKKQFINPVIQHLESPFEKDESGEPVTFL